MQGKPFQVTVRVFMKIMKKPQKNNNSSNFFQHLKKWILCINFIHDIDHSGTNYNKTSWNSVPDSKVFFCSNNLWYLFLLQERNAMKIDPEKQQCSEDSSRKYPFDSWGTWLLFSRKRKTPDWPTLFWIRSSARKHWN